MSVYRIMSSSKPQVNQLHEGLCYILIRDILIKLVLTLPFISQKKLESIFVEAILPKKSNLIVGCIYKHPCMDICTFKDHYLNPLLDNLSKEANETIVLLSDFNIDRLNFDTSEHVSTFLDDLASNSLQRQILLPIRICNTLDFFISNSFISNSTRFYKMIRQLQYW